MSALHIGDMLRQRFDDASLSASACAHTRTPLRRASALTELLIVGAAACLDGMPDAPTVVLWGSRTGMHAATIRVITDVVIAREAPLPYDFLATQPILAAIPLRQNFPCVENVLYQPWSDDVELHWLRMRMLAAAWLRGGRCTRTLCGQVESDGGAHCGQWQILELRTPG
ncbi:MAG: hypothetical protein LBF51_09135 [Zoogloeaceae bacterium]|jgi:hypothetical protein|nr:hypothetical protein [Zoogloeaceae bacterium]